ncbi:MAG: hypothetical protein ACJAUL_002153 [Paraglaciecola sp.]
MLTRDRTALVKIAIFYAIFIIFGSLVPFKANQLALGEAVQGFSHLEKLDFSIDNRSDWFTYFLLFIPLSYLLLNCCSAKQISIAARSPAHFNLWRFTVYFCWY